MIRIRAVVPPETKNLITDFLYQDDAVINIVDTNVLVSKPNGFLIEADVAREGANKILGELRKHNIHLLGSISITKIDTALSESALNAELITPGNSSEAIIWEEIDTNLRTDGSMSTTYAVLLTIATMIASMGILTDSSILIVGSMVIGPDFGPILNMAMGLYRKKPKRLRSGTIALFTGFSIAILLTALMAWVLFIFDEIPSPQTVRTNTSFISHPDIYSALVAVVAGVAGTVSLLQSKSSALVGVLISVTTVPAAAGIATFAVNSMWNDVYGSVIQLILNVAIILASSSATMFVLEKRFKRNEN